MRKKVLMLFIPLFVIVVLSFSLTPTHASIFDNLADGVKNLFPPESQKDFTIESTIMLAPQGDVNKNGQVDAGDTITFTYFLSNPTDKELTFNTLKTNIPRNTLHFIHDIRGTSSLSDKNNTIEIPNLRINPYQDLAVSFNARVNYFQNSDQTIWTQPEFITQDKKSFFKGTRKEIKAKPWKNRMLPSSVTNKNK